MRRQQARRFRRGTRRRYIALVVLVVVTVAVIVDGVRDDGRKVYGKREVELVPATRVER